MVTRRNVLRALAAGVIGFFGGRQLPTYSKVVTAPKTFAEYERQWRRLEDVVLVDRFAESILIRFRSDCLLDPYGSLLAAANKLGPGGVNPNIVKKMAITAANLPTRKLEPLGGLTIVLAMYAIYDFLGRPEYVFDNCVAWELMPLDLFLHELGRCSCFVANS